ncbi:DUF1294 domain-containing protein [Myroides guanonis]|uniref:DUF1294 domain-containing protein n=1 Tax=Myroides guanonis TaxID=1150112 RepID=UPI000B84C651|nr:DUF1294 domain-containing protein [Myroides guanonis]
MKFLFAYLIIINYISFSMFAYDKEQAKKQGRRVAEKNLLTLCFIGGSLGGWIGMNKLRHKSSKSSFKLKLLGITLFQLLILLTLFRR